MRKGKRSGKEEKGVREKEMLPGEEVGEAMVNLFFRKRRLFLGNLP